jgi:hypothetical protein
MQLNIHTHIHTGITYQVIHIVVVRWIAVLFEVALNAMSVRNIMRITVAFRTENFLPGSWKPIDSQWHQWRPKQVGPG